MMKRKSSSGFTAIEVLLAGFLMTIIIAGAFLVFGALSEKSDLLFGDTELRQRIRYVEELLRRDLERAVPTAELEWYAELDGVPGPRFNPEPFADYGSDGVPDIAEIGYDGSPTTTGWVTGTPCDSLTYNPDPRCDNAPGFQFPHATFCSAGLPPLYVACPLNPLQQLEGNGILDPGEWLIDIDANGHYTGEPFWDYMQAATASDSWDQNGTLLTGSSLNYQFDIGTNLFTTGLGTRNLSRQVDFIDVDGDGVFSPTDQYWHGSVTSLGDPTPPEDDPLTLLVDETFSAIDGTLAIRGVAGAIPGGNSGLAYKRLTAGIQPLSPFGYIDFPFPTTLYSLPTQSTNGKYDRFEIPIYDYFGGVVNKGNQDSLYFRTFVDIAGQDVPANVYYRIVFQNTNSNYSESFDDTVGYTDLDPAFLFTDPTANLVGVVNGLGIGDGVWTPGEPITPDTNRNGICDPIVDPGERRLQRIVILPGSQDPIVQDLGPAVRFNVEYFDSAVGRFVAPFSDSGIDGLFNVEEAGYLNPPNGPVNCPDRQGDDYFPTMKEIPLNSTAAASTISNNGALSATENNGSLDLLNSTGIPAATLSRNPFLQGSGGFSAPFPSGSVPFFPALPNQYGPGENQFEGFKKFGYPDAAGILVGLDNFEMIPLNAREQIPLLGHLEWMTLEPLAREQNARYGLIYGVVVNFCDPTVPAGMPGACVAASANCLSATAGYVRYLFSITDVLDSRFYRFSPGAVFDDEGWLRCSGVRDSFAFLKPGDLVFVWGFLIPPQNLSGNFGAEAVRVPVPPGYYPLIEKRGERLRLDLSKVPGGAPTPDQLRGVPAVYRAPYLPPALRIDFALEGYSPDSSVGQGIYFRDLRIWSMFGRGFDTAGRGSQGTPPSIPIRGTVFTVQPGQGSGTGTRRLNGLPY